MKNKQPLVNTTAADPAEAFCVYQTTLCPLAISADANAVTEISFAVGERERPQRENELTALAARELKEYFRGERREFTVPLRPHGTPFQQAVWATLRDIPYGETASYKQIAERVGNAKATRAVGMANNRNPIVIMIPCHRVIGANGSLTGYGGGLDIKRSLLELEKGVAGR